MATSESGNELTSKQVAIIGGGWAGLTAAVHLSQQPGIDVSLFESARQLGGRARRIPFGKLRVDNGQHLLLGAYKETLGLMETLGVDLNEKFVRQPLTLYIRNPLKRQIIKLKAPRLPAPLHLLLALLACKGFNVRERLRALQFGTRLFLYGFKFEEDISVAELMRRYKQPASLVEKFWNPLCIASMNTPIKHASAHIFLRVLHDSFRQHYRDSDLLYTREDLGSLLPDPAMEYIEKQGGFIKLGKRVTGLALDDQQLKGVYVDEQLLTFDHVIIATSAHACHNLVNPHNPLRTLKQQLEQYRYQPICTIYLQYPPETSTGRHMLGILGGHAQWVFDRAIYNQPGLMAIVISSTGPHMELDNTQLIEQVKKEIAMLYPDWPEPEDAMVIREKHATFHCTSGINRLRPEHKTPVEGLWLAGDYTNTGYPATLEGAVRSGLQCARQIIDEINPVPATV